MPVSLTLQSVAAVSVAMQFLIFTYLYRANRVRFFRYLTWAWGAFMGGKAMEIGRQLLPAGFPGAGLGLGLGVILHVVGIFLILAAGLAFRWDYRIRPLHTLPALAFAAMSIRYMARAEEGLTSMGFVGGTIVLLAGLAFWPRPGAPATPAGGRFLGVALGLWGLHGMVTPYLSLSPGTRLVAVNVSFVLLYFIVVFAIVIVVLDRARGEAAALKEFNERLIDGLGGGLQLVDGAFTVRHANRWMAEQLGGAAGRRCHEVVAADGRPCPGCPMAARATLAAPAQVRVAGPGGRRLELTCSPVRQPDGQVFLLELVADVTERERLRGRLAEAERMASVGELAAGVAHEIRNPLAAIVNATALLERQEALAPDERATTIGALRKEARRLNGILSDFLRFARPGEPKRVPGDLRDVVTHVAALVGEERTRTPGLAVETRLEPDLPRLAFDPDQITQVLWNVCLNGIEAMQGQGRLVIHGRREGAEAVLEVADTGPGVAPEDRGRIFEPFYSRRAGGTGLGLPIARRIVAAHGGRVEIESAPGQGTRVLIRLPVT